MQRARKRAALIRRDGNFCHYCKKKLSKDDCTIEHVIPTSQGGTNKLDNLVLACVECNSRRGNYSYSEYYLLRKNSREGLTHFPFSQIKKMIGDKR